MSPEVLASLSSYEFSRRILQSSSSGSSRHSPTGAIAPSDSPRMSPKRPRLDIHPAQSYEGQNRERITIQVIEERTDLRRSDWSQDHDQDLQHGGLIDLATSISLPVGKSNEKSSDPATSPEDHQDGSDKIGLASSLKSARPPRPPWSRTRSGGVWYQSQKGTSSQEHSSVHSTKSSHAKTESEQATPSIVALRPPPRPEQSVNPSVHRITIETPFQPTVNVDDVRRVPDTSKKHERRRSSIDALRVLSMPLRTIRRVAKEKSIKTPSSTPTTTGETATPAAFSRGHKTLLKRDQTSATLDRVSSVLEDYRPPNFKNRLRAFTGHKSISTTNSSDCPESRQEHGNPVVSPFMIPRRESISLIQDEAASIYSILAGSTPKNSPAEAATYKLKRSPSAETEEFLKIDISIRGGTSYLPSEARRIHTPPLPEAKSSGRGFFFDYIAPDADACEKVFRAPTATPNAARGTTSHHTTRPVSQSSNADDLARQGSNILQVQTRTEPVKRPYKCPQHKVSTASSTSGTTSRVPTAITDFYDVKLAEIDASQSSLDLVTDIGCQQNHRQRRCHGHDQSTMAETRRQKYEAMLDHSIPEHRPSSPLCPRNPRYWRVVKKKGSQFRGCWMHGFGEWEADKVPGVKVQHLVNK